MATLDSIVSSLSTLKVEPTITIGEILTIIILGPTLILLIIYTAATLGLWKQARFQSHLAISPFLLFEIDDENKFFIRNVGNSAAFNVSMDALQISVRDTSKKKLFQLIFDEINIIESKERKVLSFTNYLDGQKTDANISSHLNPKYQKDSNFKFTLSYTNPIGIRYFTTFQAGKDGVRVLKISRVRSWNRLLLWIEKKGERFLLRWWGHRLT